jgi:hypothetical protein
MQFSGGASGYLAADLTFETRGGPFSLSNGEANLKLDALYANATRSSTAGWSRVR